MKPRSTTALKVGLKVDADTLPPGTLDKADLQSPATTVALLKMNAVVGLQANRGLEQPHRAAVTAEQQRDVVEYLKSL